MFRPGILLCAAAIAAGPLAAHAAPTYNVTVIPTAAGTVNTVMGAMNNYSGTAGYSQGSNGSPWTATAYYDGRPQTLHYMKGETAIANDISDGGVIVGTLTQYSGYNNAAIWYRGELVRLITGGIYSNSEATAVNASGQVVGAMSTTERSSMHAFVYDGNQTIDLGTLGGFDSFGADINDNGAVTGRSSLIGGRRHAFVYMNGTMTDIGSLGGDSAGVAINNDGVVAGWSYLPNQAAHAFIYANGQMIDLGTLGGWSSTAADINNAGQVVGSSSVGNTNHAFLYTDGDMFDLNGLIDSSLGWTLTAAADINDKGQILATGCMAGGNCASVVLSLVDGEQFYVPEPEAFTAGLAGLALFGWLRRRKQA